MSRIRRLVLLLVMTAAIVTVYPRTVAATGNTDPAKDAPTIAVTYPTSNLVLDASRTTSITLQASATDVDEPILYVRFMICPASGAGCSGATSIIGPITSGPYQAQWTLPQAVSDRAISTPYLIWAEGQNTLGQTRQSATVAFTITQPAPGPTVKLVAPNGQANEVGFVSPASPVLYATATPGNTSPASTIAKVEFLDGGIVIGTLTAPNSSPTGYAFTWRGAAPGTHLVTVRATDTLGGVGVSDPLSVYVLAANQPPKVTLTSPTTGQSLSSRDSVSLSASVVAGTGRIQRVEFIAGTTVIATALSAPYTSNWVNPPPGNYTITARAIDDIGASTASSGAYLQVLAVPRAPSVVLTAPAPGSTASSGVPLVLTANALAPDGTIGKVEFYAGSSFIGSSSIAPYRVTWAAPVVGKAVLTAKAYDVQGASGVSTPTTITVVSSQPPTVTVSAAPSAPTYAAPANVKLMASASAPSGVIAKVDFVMNGVVLASRTAAPYEYVWANIAAGTYSVTARATDGLNSTTTSAPLVVRVVNNVPPTVQMTAPTDGQTLYAGQPVALSATATDSDGIISKVEFLVDGATVGTSLVPPFNAVWNASGVGSHAVSARVTDNLGTAATSAPRTVSVLANGVPSIAVTSPSAGQAFTVGQAIPFAATSADPDGTVSKVEYLVDGVVIGSASAVPFGHSWSGAGAGAHLVTARATDNRGAVATSAPIPITVTTSTVPVVALLAPVANRTFSVGGMVPLAATATIVGGAIARVDFYAGSTLIGTSTTAPYQLAWTPPVAGTYTLTANATDARGVANVSTGVSTRVVTPVLTIASPVANAAIAAEFVTVAGTYQGPANVGITINGMLAANDGQGNYFLNNVPLASGANTLNVVLTTPDGQTLTRTVGVSSTAVSPMQVYADPDVAFASATFTIRLQNRTKVPLKTVSFQNLVGAQLDSSVLDQATLGKLTYSTPGVYRPTFVVTDAAGKTYTQALTLLVRDRNALDTMLKNAWSDFALALARGDRSSALVAMSSAARGQYGPIFDALAPYMTQIIPSWSPPITGLLGEDIGEFTIRRAVDGVNQLFFVYFVRDGHGIWRLNSM